MPILEKAPNEVHELIDQLVTKYFSQLRDYGTTYNVLFAFAKLYKNGDPRGPAVTLHGRECLAKIRIVPYRDRVNGIADAEIIIDGKRWEELGDEQREALLDHELCHLEGVFDAKGDLKRDDLDRPCLRIARHDHDFGWFNATVRRHGIHSIEWQQYQNFATVDGAPLRQLWLPYVTTQVSTGEAPGRRDRKSRAVAG